MEVSLTYVATLVALVDAQDHLLLFFACSHLQSALISAGHLTLTLELYSAAASRLVPAFDWTANGNASPIRAESVRIGGIRHPTQDLLSSTTCHCWTTSLHLCLSGKHLVVVAHGQQQHQQHADRLRGRFRPPLIGPRLAASAYCLSIRRLLQAPLPIRESHVRIAADNTAPHPSGVQQPV